MRTRIKCHNLCFSEHEFYVSCIFKYLSTNQIQIQIQVQEVYMCGEEAEPEFTIQWLLDDKFNAYNDHRRVID